ncbi:MAG: Fur family transcriptional regulator [candidate division FCPU426 bacterium]
MQREVEQFCDFLRKKGLKLTPQRLRIAETVFVTHRHFTADQLYELVKKVEPLVGKVTVYRTLEHLVDSGMVEELSINKGVSTYEHVAGHGHHDHLICVHCGKIVELSSERLEKVKNEEAEGRGFQVLSHSLKIYGLCPDCRPKST